MFAATAPTDQRAGVRPIAFVLQNGGSFGTPVTLKVRPEDLTRTEPSRIAVHQTLGRAVQGWADNFGEGLPSATIAGHTGWRASGTSGQDGAQAFERLNQLVMREYHQAKQAAIEAGMDPAIVKLLFVDMLDNFTWNVAPMNFVLRRSRNRPLLFQYNISLQAISTDIDNPLRIVPFFGSMSSGLSALDGVIGKLWGLAGNIHDWVAKAVAFKDKVLAPIATFVHKFAVMSTQVFEATRYAVGSITNGIRSTANSLIGIAADMATVGINIFRTIGSIAGLPDEIKSAASRVSSAYNEVLCIFQNSLRKRKTYEDYDGLYGASNCSSTTGGRGPSSFANLNAFSLMQLDPSGVSVTSGAYSGIGSIARTDPVLAPMSLPELGRNVEQINNGVYISPGTPGVTFGAGQ